MVHSNWVPLQKVHFSEILMSVGLKSCGTGPDPGVSEVGDQFIGKIDKQMQSLKICKL